MENSIFQSNSSLLIEQTKKDWLKIGTNKNLKNKYKEYTFDPIYFQEENPHNNTLHKAFEWDICVSIDIQNEPQANQKALEYLQLGANSICFLNFNNHKLCNILKGIQLDIIKINFNNFYDLENLIKQILEIQKNQSCILRGCFYNNEISKSELFLLQKNCQNIIF